MAQMVRSTLENVENEEGKKMSNGSTMIPLFPTLFLKDDFRN